MNGTVTIDVNDYNNLRDGNAQLVEDMKAISDATKEEGITFVYTRFRDSFTYAKYITNSSVIKELSEQVKELDEEVTKKTNELRKTVEVMESFRREVKQYRDFEESVKKGNTSFDDQIIKEEPKPKRTFWSKWF